MKSLRRPATASAAADTQQASSRNGSDRKAPEVFQQARDAWLRLYADAAAPATAQAVLDLVREHPVLIKWHPELAVRARETMNRHQAESSATNRQALAWLVRSFVRTATWLARRIARSLWPRQREAIRNHAVPAPRPAPREAAVSDRGPFAVRSPASSGWINRPGRHAMADRHA